MLEKLTREDFVPQVGSAFRVDAGATALDLTLVEARDLSLKSRAPDAGRQPFSLLFLGPKEPLLPQRIYPLEHEALGRLEIFLVPIGAGDEGVQYEAIFN